MANEEQKATIVDSVSLGKVIRAVRIQAGLTQADAAALCGVSTPFLNGLERGKPTARIGLALTVCRGLGIRVLLEPPEPLSVEQPARKPRRKA